MQRLPFVLLVCLCEFAALCLPAVAGAQERGVSVGLAYQWLRFDHFTLPRGISGDVAVDLTPRLAAVAAIDRSSAEIEAFGFDQRTTLVGVTGGVRWHVVRTSVLRFYTQVSAGALRQRVEIDRFGSDSRSHLLLQPGGGFDLQLTRRLATFAQADWRHVRQEPHRDGIRLLVGGRVVLR
jgi:hypothetical protein